MTRIKRLVAGTSALALMTAPMIAIAAPVGTAANTDITNTVSVNYQVGGVAQTQVQATDTFKVDRKVNVTVATTDAAPVAVTPGQTNAVTTFTVTNNSNATLDFLLAATNQTGGASNFNGAVNESFDTSNIRIYVETNGTPGFQLGSDASVSTIASLASGDVATVYVVSNMTDPSTGLPADNAIATVLLTATAASGALVGAPITGAPGATAGSGGSAIAQDSAANGKNTMETVFADAAYLTYDAQYNGKHAARSDYKVTAARLSVNKYSRVISDPVGSASPRAIPGAVVEYCIVVTNASGGSTATTVAVTDQVPATMTYLPNSVYLNGAFTAPDTCAGTGGTAGTDAANYTAGTTTVSNTFTSIASTETRTLRFQATIK